MNGKQVIAQLKAQGWQVVRIEGSHHILEKAGRPRAVPVPVHGSRDLGAGLLGRDRTSDRGEAEMNLGYPYTVEPQDDGGLFVQFVDFEEAFTEGATPEEAAYNAAEVLSGILGYRLAHGQAIPVPSVVAGQPIAYPSPAVQAAALIRLAREERPLSEVAHALETSWAAQRLEDPHHWPTLKQLDRAARVLGKRLVLSLD